MATIHNPAAPKGLNRRATRRDSSVAWLERTNPLKGLSISQAVNVFDCARGGDTQRLHWMFAEIERVNPILLTCVERRAAALSMKPWQVTARPSGDETLGGEEKQAVEEFLSGIGNFGEMVEHLDNAFFRGFSYAQPIWENGFVNEVSLLPSWQFLEKDGVLLFNPACNGFTADAQEVDDAWLIGLKRDRAIDFPALSIHIREAVGERDWGRFLERYALPKPAVFMAENATQEQRADYLEAATKVENGEVSVWPAGTNMIDFAGGSRGTDPFSSFIRHQEELVVLLSTGGTLTSLAQADTGSLAGGAQMDVWREIVARDARLVAQALQRDLISRFLDYHFPGQAKLVDFSFDLTTKPTPKEMAEVAAVLKSAGYSVNQEELEEATGFTLEKDPISPPMGGGMMMNKSAGGKTPLQNNENRLQNASKASDGQVDPSDAPPSQIAKKRPNKQLKKRTVEELLEEAMAEAMAEAIENRECRAKNPTTCRVHGTPRELKTKGFQDNFGNSNPETLAANPKMNAERGKSVISHILSKKSGHEPHAMYRKDVGWIGVDYGKPGNASNSYSGGHGISHIVGKHEGAIDGAVDVILTGTAYKHDKSRHKVYIIKDRTAIVLSKDREGRLLLTDFENISDKQFADYTSKGKYHARGENK